MMMLTAYVLDRVLADPPHWPHPVRWMGWLIHRLEQGLFRWEDSPRWKMTKGSLLVLAVVLATYAAAYWLVHLFGWIHPWAGNALIVYLAYTTLSAKGLKAAAMKVLSPLEDQDLHGARQALSMIVGRETAQLPEAAVVRGAVETVAENFSDGVVAPLFYYFLGGVPLALTYKAVNTLDSMLGYKNERYLYFGRVAARLDDVMNWIPARISVGFLLAAALLTGNDWKRGWQTALRDGRNHQSPNAGWPEAAMAGALSIQLGGTNTYFGKQVVKPTIGDLVIPLKPEHIRQSVRLLDVASLLAVVTGVFLVWWIGG